VAVVGVVVVVVTVGQLGPLPPEHASQQLVQVPGVPAFAMQLVASFFVLQLVPFAVVEQHVTASPFPQVEWAAHFLTVPLQLVGRKFGSDGASCERD
jgi:hypothetical protein